MDGMLEACCKCVPIMRFGDCHHLLWMTCGALTRSMGRVGCLSEAESIGLELSRSGACDVAWGRRSNALEH